jgi:drug/metabolite transporter (DMT)-like permease
VLYAFGLGRGQPIVIAAVLNLDPFWAAVIAYLVAGKKIPTSLLTFTLCLIVSFAGAMLLAISQTGAQSMGLQMFDSGAFLALGLALPVPVLWAFSGSLVGKWFSDFDEHASVAVTFVTAAVVVVPITLAIAYAQSVLQVTTDILPALALLALGTILATGLSRVLYQRALRRVKEIMAPPARSPLETAVPTSRLRRAGAQGTKPFYQSACRAMVTIGRPPGSARTDQVLGDLIIC